MKRTVECTICGWKDSGWFLAMKMIKHLKIWHPELVDPFTKLPFKTEINSKKGKP